MRKQYMVIDGQWGSTGKGLICGYLALQRRPDTVVCNFGANAGHTVVLDNGYPVMTQILPSAIIAPSVKNILIGGGAIIDPTIFNNEVQKFGELLKNKRIYIHESAAVIKQEHKDTEAASLNRISSTCKGVGAAQAAKIMRVSGVTARDNAPELLKNNNVKIVGVMEFAELVNGAKVLQIESAQGMELGLNSGGFYPYCTSRDINIYQVLSDCSIPHTVDPSDLEVVVTMRTFPIRVGDAYDADGKKIGTSGGVYPDQKEISWEKLGVDVERTTVTKKIRRVFTWSNENLHKVRVLLNPSAIFLNFTNYLESNSSFESKKTRQFVRNIENSCGHPGLVRWIGTGAKVGDVIERKYL